MPQSRHIVEDNISLHSIQSILDSLEKDLAQSGDTLDCEEEVHLSNNADTDSSSAGPSSLPILDLTEEKASSKPLLTTSISLGVQPVPPPRPKRKKKLKDYEKAKELVDKEKNLGVTRLKCYSSNGDSDVDEASVKADTPTEDRSFTDSEATPLESPISTVPSRSATLSLESPVEAKEAFEFFNAHQIPQKEENDQPETMDATKTATSPSSDTSETFSKQAISLVVSGPLSPHPISPPTPTSPPAIGMVERFRSFKHKLVDLRAKEEPPQETMKEKLFRKYTHNQISIFLESTFYFQLSLFQTTTFFHSNLTTFLSTN